MVVAFVVGLPAYSVHAILPILAHRPALARILAGQSHVVVLAYTGGTMVLIGLLLSVLGLTEHLTVARSFLGRSFVTGIGAP